MLKIPRVLHVAGLVVSYHHYVLYTVVCSQIILVMKAVGFTVCTFLIKHRVVLFIVFVSCTVPRVFKVPYVAGVRMLCSTSIK
jgi:hypothetical protein